MGAGKGGNYGKGKGDDEEKIGNFVDNLLNLLEEFSLSDMGWFGIPSQHNVRVIFCEDPLKTMMDFVNRIIPGSKIEPLPRGNGFKATFGDKFRIVYRETSTSGPPAVTLWTPNGAQNASSLIDIEIGDQIFRIRYQKIHFVQEEKSDEDEGSDSNDDN